MASNNNSQCTLSNRKIACQCSCLRTQHASRALLRETDKQQGLHHQCRRNQGHRLNPVHNPAHCTTNRTNQLRIEAQSNRIWNSKSQTLTLANRTERQLTEPTHDSSEVSPSFQLGMSGKQQRRRRRRSSTAAPTVKLSGGQDRVNGRAGERERTYTTAISTGGTSR